VVVLQDFFSKILQTHHTYPILLHA
jgi:hypothetical protein